jgi:hypothetical protein
MTFNATNANSWNKIEAFYSTNFWLFSFSMLIKFKSHYYTRKGYFLITDLWFRSFEKLSFEFLSKTGELMDWGLSQGVFRGKEGGRPIIELFITCLTWTKLTGLYRPLSPFFHHLMEGGYNEFSKELFPDGTIYPDFVEIWVLHFCFSSNKHSLKFLLFKWAKAFGREIHFYV